MRRWLMEITKWTQDEIKTKFSHCNTLGELIRSLESYYIKKDEVICEIQVDGRLLSEAEEQIYNENPVNNFSEIVVKSNNLNGLFGESLDSLTMILKEIEEKLVMTSDQFRILNLNAGQQDFDVSIKRIQLAFDLNSHFLQMLERFFKPELVAQFKNQWDIIQKDFLSLSRQVYETFQKKDYILLSDLLEYEYSNVLQRWSVWVQSIKSQFGC